ncbi:small conductance mechanosensitive channel [Litorivivens lipolytica]|uniref:Small conductance mechanosensitive channel n=1 Tax=Litorivivens lipolytica TaxID=1524264 RepID=A0A7W4W4Y6_9GAMM|nr:mechanosensitive ion channel family protein [Litorivivens lipolytica]MBB3047527.1 small conductance mechanosensitive channel [Litorivivens lipolytica]
MEGLVNFTARSREVLISLTENAMTWLATSGLQIILIIFGAWIALTVSRRLLNRVHRGIAGKDQDAERVKRADTLTGILGTLIWAALFLAAGMMVLKEVGVDIAPIIAVAGLGGLAIGFGAQNLVRDVITGFFLLAEDQIRVGDIVEAGGLSGEVVSLGLRTVRMRALDGTLHIIPNGNVTTVSNMTKDYGYALANVGVAYREDTDQVFDIIEEVGAELRNDATFASEITEDMEVHGITSFADSAVIIRCRMKTLPGSQWMVLREFNRRLKKRFDAANIEIPFPHMTLYAGEGKGGDAPVLPIQMQDKAA